MHTFEKPIFTTIFPAVEVYSKIGIRGRLTPAMSWIAENQSF